MRALGWVVVLAVAIPQSAGVRDGVRISIAPTLVKIRPTEPLPPAVTPAGQIALVAARGECEDAQLVVSAGDSPVLALSARATALALGGRTVPVELFREAFLDVKTPSNTEGATGLWPDALVPDVDDVVHEKRNAFPVDVPAHRHQPLLARACVPRGAAPGVYSGTVALAWRGGKAEVPMRLDVRDVTIPATSSLPVAFGLSGRSLLFGHFGAKRPDDVRVELVERYAKEALDHRISLFEMSRIMPPVTRAPGLGVDFGEWDRELSPLLAGKSSWNGGRPTALDLRLPPELPESDWKPYAQLVARHFGALGVGDLLFAYVMDEPKAAQFPELVQRLDALQGSGIRRLVTTALDPRLVGKVDIWTENVNCFEFKKRPDEFCPRTVARDAYDAREAKGDRVWWYQSCSSHGCGSGPFGDARDDYFRGWPSYMVDVDGPANEAMGWLAFTHRIDGELYFDTAYAYGHGDPWESLWAFGGNGDGTLFYPGRPDRIGGKTDVPVASLRLELIRDGLEDYELLRLLAAKGPAGSRRALAIATGLAPRLYDFSHDPAAWARAREALFDALAPVRRR